MTSYLKLSIDCYVRQSRSMHVARDIRWAAAHAARRRSSHETSQMDLNNASSVWIRGGEEANRPAATAVPPPAVVSFDPSTHAYRFHGRRLISVTQAIQAAGLIRSEWYTARGAPGGAF
jgi:hypothetical protein